MGTLVKYKPVANINQLHIIFPISLHTLNYCPYVKPLEYITELLNDKREGSLYYELVKKGYIIDLMAGPLDVQEHFLLFGFLMDITQSGMEEYQKILNDIFAYLRITRKDGITL